MLRLLDRAGKGFRQVTRMPLAGFCCALCLRILPDRCASFGHYPAKAAGGRRTTLLCRRCNSFLGTEYEPEAVTMATRAAGTEETGYLIPNFVFTPPGGPRIRRDALVTRDRASRQYRFTVQPLRRRNPHIESQLDAMRSRLEKAEMSLPYANSEVARLGALSWGYLALFDALGYSFALSPALGRVRRVLLAATTEYLGRGTLLSWGKLPSPFESAEPVVLLTNAGTDADPVAVPIAVGARMGRHVAVFPLADDLAGSVYDRLDAAFSLTGRITMPLVQLSWAEAFGGDEARSRLAEAASWTWTGGPRPTALVRHDVARARAVVAAPVAIGTRASVTEPPAWRDGVRELRGVVAIEDWVEVVAGEVRHLDPRSGVADDALTGLLGRAVETRDVSALQRDLTATLPAVAASHVLDMFRVFVLGEDRREFDAIAAAHAQDAFTSMVRRATGQWVVGGHLDQRRRGQTGVVAAVLVWPTGNVVVGEFYTRATLLLAASTSVTDAVLTKRLQRRSVMSLDPGRRSRTCRCGTDLGQAGRPPGIGRRTLV